VTDFFDVVARQRAHRRFTDEPVDDATVERMLEAAVRAPNAENRQPWVFLVVREPALRGALGDLMARAWDGGGKQWSESRISARFLADVESGMHGGFAGAPVMIVVGADLTRTAEPTVASSVFPAIQNLLLAAGALGLGSALTTIATGFAAELRELLSLPETVRVVAIVPIGHPAKQLGPSKRDPAREHAHRDRYGAPWP
jgi:nitroreductase